RASPRLRERLPQGGALGRQLFGQPRSDEAEDLVVIFELAPPGARIDRRQLAEFVAAEILQSLPFEIGEFGHEADGGFHRMGLALTALDDPFQYAHVLAETRPDELAAGICPEPVDAEDLRTVRNRAAQLEPAVKIIADA